MEVTNTAWEHVDKLESSGSEPEDNSDEEHLNMKMVQNPGLYPGFQ